jgi:hypothetical protein
VSAEATSLESSVWRALDHGFADALYTLRTSSPLGALSAAEWSVFATQAIAWARSDDPLTQSELALLAGLNVRTVRRLTLRLEEVGVVAPIRMTGGGVSYQPGPLLAERLREFARRRDPHVAIRSVSSGSGESAAAPGRNVAPEPPVSSRSAGSGDDPLLIKKIEKGSSSSLDRQGIRAAACRALAARYQFGRPDATPPTSFAEADIAVVMNVTAHGTWTEEELDQVHRDAILGASLHSRTSPPAVAYIWGKQPYFDWNVRKGRDKRRESEPAAKRPRKPKPPDEPPATLAELVEIGRLGAALLSGPSPFDTKRPVNARFFKGPDS